MKVIRRSLWLILMIGLLAWPVLNGVQTVQRERQIKTLLLAVQEALQNYHVDQERYIPREQLTGSEIISVLSDFDFLPEMPINPWTKAEWKLDGEEPDFLEYQTDPNFETYALRAIDRKSGAVVLEIDSVSSPSLE